MWLSGQDNAAGLMPWNVSKHLVGQHDQRQHGVWAQGGGGGSNSGNSSSAIQGDSLEEQTKDWEAQYSAMSDEMIAIRDSIRQSSKKVPSGRGKYQDVDRDLRGRATNLRQKLDSAMRRRRDEGGGVRPFTDSKEVMYADDELKGHIKQLEALQRDVANHADSVEGFLDSK